MSEELRQKEKTAAPSEAAASDRAPMVDGHRIDSEHALANRPPPLPPLGSQATTDSASSDSTSESQLGTDAAKSDELLLQASQIAEHLRSELAELNRREQRLNGQLSVLDQERRNVRLWANQFEQEIRERETELNDRDAEISKRADANQKLDVDLREQDQALTAAREELARERTALKDDLERELDEDRQILADAQQSLDEERRQLRQQMQTNQDEHYAALQQARDQLKTDREDLKERLTQEALTEELCQQRDQFLQDRSDWEATREAEQQNLKNEQRIHDQALLRAQHELTEVRRQQAEQLIVDRTQCDSELLNARRQHEIELQENRAEFESERCEFESQMRFQQEHLQKARGEFEGTKNEFRAEVQRSKNELLHLDLLNGLSRRQLEKRREVLEKQEKSISRERVLLEKSRRDADEESVKGRSRLKSDRSAWEQEREAQQAELRRQHDMLTLHAENLEGRRQRLDQLRAELEQTHRTTLEMRMSVEEAWAQFSQAAGDSVAKDRVEAARQALADHYEHLREAMGQQRSDVEESRTQFLRQKDEFRSERETLTTWIGEREERLRSHEEQLNREAEQLDAQEAVWREARDRWADEKLEAESIIRDLLREIEELTDRCTRIELESTSPQHTENDSVAPT